MSFRTTLLLAGAILLGCRSAPDSPEVAAPPPGGAVTIWTDSTELFMEYPGLVVGAPAKFNVHLTDLSDFAPLRSGKVSFRFDPDGGGDGFTVVQESPRAPGIYGPAPEFPRPGVWNLTITVESPQVRDVITVPALRVWATAAEVPVETGGSGGGIGFLKEQQWKSPGFRTEFVGQDSLDGVVRGHRDGRPRGGPLCPGGGADRRADRRGRGGGIAHPRPASRTGRGPVDPHAGDGRSRERVRRSARGAAGGGKRVRARQATLRPRGRARTASARGPETACRWRARRSPA